MVKPTAPEPRIIIAHVADSGTAPETVVVNVIAVRAPVCGRCSAQGVYRQQISGRERQAVACKLPLSTDPAGVSCGASSLTPVPVVSSIVERCMGDDTKETLPATAGALETFEAC